MALKGSVSIVFHQGLPSILTLLEKLNQKTGLRYSLRLQLSPRDSEPISDKEVDKVVDFQGLGNDLWWGTFSSDVFKKEIEMTAAENGYYLESFSPSLYFFVSIIHALVELGGEIESNLPSIYFPDWKDQRWDVNQLPKEALRGRKRN